MADPLPSRLRVQVTSLVASVRSSKLARAALVTGALTILCKGIGFAKELVVASQFGIGSTYDSYLVAVVLPNLAVNVFSRSFAAALVMKYVQDRTNFDDETARQRFSASMFWGAAFVVAVSVTGMVLGPVLLPWLSPGFRPEVLASTQRLVWLLFPYSVLAGTSVIWASILNARGRFVASSASPGVISLVMIVAVTCWRTTDARVLVGGLTAGVFIDLIVLGYCLRREGLPLVPSVGRWQPEHRWIAAQTLPMIVGSTLQFCTVMADQSMASMLGEGSVSELNYGNRIAAMILGLIALPMGKILFPHFVQLIEARKWEDVQRTLRRSMLVLLTISIPITILLIVFSVPIVNWTFRRGQFTSEMATRVAAVQVMCALQIPFYLWGVLLARLTVALQMRRVMVGCGVMNLSMNIAMNYLLMQPLGITGIALSTAIVYLVASCYFSVAIRGVLQRKIREQMKTVETSESGLEADPAPRLAA